MVALLRYALTLAIGIGIGWFVARPIENPPSTLPDTANSPSQSTAGGQRPSVVQAAVSEPKVSTLAEILRIPSDYLQTAALYNLGRDATPDQLETLLAEAAGLGQVSERRAATSILYSRYAELDPESAVEHVLSHGGVFANRWLNSIFHAWSRHDLAAAVARAAELAPNHKAVAGAALLNARDDLPADERQEIAQQLGIENVMQQLESRRQTAMTDTDPQEAWQAALATDNVQSRMERLYRVASAWASSDPLAALNAVASMAEPSLRGGLQQQISRVWAQSDPRGAVDWAMAQPSTPSRGSVLGAALGTLAITEPYDAISLAEGLSGREREEVLGLILQGWGSADPRAAADWIEDSPATLTSNVVVSFASTYAMQYPADAFNWAISLPKAQSGTATQIVLSVVSQNDPANAARLVMRIPEANARANAARNVVRNWAESDPGAAGAWIAGLDGGEQRAQLYSSLLGRWSRHDRSAATRFLDRIPTPAERDAATVGIIGSAGDDPAFAERLYEGIQDASQRQAAAQQLYHLFRRADPARAERYREAAGID